MIEITLALYEMATLLVPFLVAYFALRAHAHRLGSTVAGLLPGLVFAVYLFAIVYVTSMGTVYELGFILDGSYPIDNRINLVPFSTGISSGALLNVILFVPLGFLLPLIWRQGARLGPVVGFGFLLSLSIELLQLLNFRTTDIDDVLTNTLGALVGFGLFKLWERLAGSKRRDARHAAYSWNLHTVRNALLPSLAEPALYVATMFLGHFFLFDALGFTLAVFGSIP